jgi:hypothetical protein
MQYLTVLYSQVFLVFISQNLTTMFYHIDIFKILNIFYLDILRKPFTLI